MKTFKITGVDQYELTLPYNKLGKNVSVSGEEDMQVSDGYHTMDELYEHRVSLWIKVCKFYVFLNGLAPRVEKETKISLNKEGQDDPNTVFVVRNIPVWRSKLHSDGSAFEGWFILGIGKEKGEQITYHLPLSRWDETAFAETLDNAPEWDNHTPIDVLERLAKL